MSEIPENKKVILKEIIPQLHAGKPLQEVKERFRGILDYDGQPPNLHQVFCCERQDWKILRDDGSNTRYN